MEATITTSRGTIGIQTGTEGPRNDPYSYTETIWTPTGKEPTVLREGIGVSISRLGNRVVAMDAVEEKAMTAFFWDMVGICLVLLLWVVPMEHQQPLH